MGILDEKVAIVTGGGRGIGREHCLSLARSGARVIVNDPGVGLRGDASSEDPSDAVVREITELGGSATANRGSVTSCQDCANMVEQAVERYGRLDIVVNNAGILRDKMITSLSEDDFDAVIAVHLKGTLAMTKHASDFWRSEAKNGRNGGGAIINTTSGAGLSGNVGQAAYASAKAGIVGLTLVTALEMSRYGVTCNAISPVAFTRMSEGLAAGAVHDGQYSMMHPGNASPLVAYLGSADARWITGQVFRVEGNSVILMNGWGQGSRYAAPGETFLAADNLDVPMRRIFGAYPAALVSPLT